VDHIIKFIVTRDPNFDIRTFGGGEARIDDDALDLFDRRTEAGDADIPAKLEGFLGQGRKLLVYHGFSDPALPAFRTIRHYEAMIRRTGLDKLRKDMRLFMVPGMHHCGGGPGPNVFDTLSALEQWVEHGVAPDAIPATHFVNNNPALGVDRTMPLCAFPEEAQFSGAGNVNSAANWSCTPNQRLFEVGPNGRQAGLGGDDHGDEGDQSQGDRQ
jgi:feruloyl esterase